MRVIRFFIFLMLLTPVISYGQKANFELADKFTTDKMDKMVGSLSVNANWLKDKDQFWYQYETSEGKDWYMVDAARKTKRQLFDKEFMASSLNEIFKRPFNAKDLPLKGFKFDEDKNQFTFHVDSINFHYNVGATAIVQGDTLKKEKRENWTTYSPDSIWIAFSRNHNLYLMKADDADSVEFQLTTDGEKWYSYNANDGDTTSTKRLRTRARWFEDSKKLYVVKQDRRNLNEIWVINSLKKERPELETYKYAMPGEENVPQYEMHTFDVATKSAVQLSIDKWKDQAIGGPYFGRGGGVFTTKGSDFIYFIRRNRTWTTLDVCKANTNTGEVQVLWSEESKPYFNTRYATLHVINEGSEFLWFSERTGWGQFYRYNANGQLKNAITKGHFTANSITKIDTAKQVVYFQAYGREAGVHPYYAMGYKVNFDGSGMQLLTPEDANHSFNMSDKMNYFVDNYSRVDLAPKSVLRDKEGKVVLALEETNLTRLNEAGWQMPENFKVKANDDATDLYGVMWKPFDFDPTKKYPVIAYVYPGPQSEPFPTRFSIGGSGGRNVALAQLGFIVVAVGQRGGSPIRSKYYHNWGYGNMRDYPLEDNKYALEQLGSTYDFIDLNKVGITGHSGGGFMSTAALLSFPDFYKVAVSSAGNHDNNIYNVWWGEVHHGVQEKTRKVKKENASGEEEEVEETYFQSQIKTNIELAKNLKGKLLLVHGDMDNNVSPSNTIRLVDALVKANKRFDLMILPGARHGFGRSNDYFERLKWHYFAEHLIGDYRSSTDLKNPDN